MTQRTFTLWPSCHHHPPTEHFCQPAPKLCVMPRASHLFSLRIWQLLFSWLCFFETRSCFVVKVGLKACSSCLSLVSTTRITNYRHALLCPTLFCFLSLNLLATGSMHCLTKNTAFYGGFTVGSCKHTLDVTRLDGPFVNMGRAYFFKGFLEGLVK